MPIDQPSRRLLPQLAVATLSGAWLACASPYALPPNSKPLRESQPYHVPNYSGLLPGAWTLVSELEASDSKTVLPNVLDRQADLTGVKSWQTFRFTRDGLLSLTSGKTTETLVWAVTQDQLTLHLKGGTESDRWQITITGDYLFLRSLEDSDTYTLRKTGG